MNSNRVALLCSGIEEYGVASVLELYARAMPNATFICLAPGPMHERLLTQGVDTVLIGQNSFRSARRSTLMTVGQLPMIALEGRHVARDVLPVLITRGIQVLHLNWMPHYFASPWLRSHGIRSVWQIHNNLNERRLWGLGRHLYYTLARRGADLLLPVSEFTARQWDGAGVPARVVHTAPLPAEQRAFAPLPRSGPVRCVAAGRLMSDKGFHVAVEAISEARAQGANVTLDVFGGPLDGNPYATRLRELISRRGLEDIAQLRGYEPDLRSRHRSYDVALQCRLDPEPCSVWVGEALVDGLLVLASSTGGTPELIRHAETGFLYPPADHHTLASQLVLVSRDRDRADSMRVAAIQWSRQYLTPDRMAAETQASYEKVAAVA